MISKRFNAFGVIVLAALILCSLSIKSENESATIDCPPADNYTTTNSTDGTISFYAEINNSFDLTNLDLAYTEIPSANINSSACDVSIISQGASGTDLEPATISDQEFLYFSVSTDKNVYAALEPVIIIINAPDLADINVVITNSQNEYGYYYSDQKYPAAYIFHLTSVPGTYTVKAVLYTNGETRTRITTFEVLPGDEKTKIVQIDAPTRINEGEPTLFSAVSEYGNSSEYTWDFDDGTVLHGREVSHTFSNAGVFVIKVKASDGNSSASDTAIVHVNPLEYKFTAHVMNQDGKPFSSVSVSLNDTEAVTSTDGNAIFYVNPGVYSLRADKAGYLSFVTQHEIRNEEYFEITLYDTIPVADSLNKIRSRNNLADVSIKDEHNALVNNNLNIDQVFSLEMSISRNSGTKGITHLEQRDIVIGIHDIKAQDVHWENSSLMTVATSDVEMENGLSKKGYYAVALITVENVSLFYPYEYYGTLTFNSSDIVFNKLLYCPTKNIDACVSITPCQSTSYPGGFCFAANDSLVTVFVPHFSTIVIALDNRTADVAVQSPSNETPLLSGEQAYLNFTINETVEAFYSLDGGDFIALGINNAFSTVLGGNRTHNIVSNGNHTILITIRDEVNNTGAAAYAFNVNDNRTPILNVTNNNAQLNNSIITGSGETRISVSSDEYAKISYALNELNFTDYIDIGENKTLLITLHAKNGSNALILNATDYQGNLRTYFYIFNVTPPAIENITFNISTDKQLYNRSESVYIRVEAPANISVTVSVVGGQTVYYQTHLGSITYIYDDTLNIGNYSVVGVMTYNGNITVKTITFRVVSPEPACLPLSVVLSSDKSLLKEQESVAFTATIQGGKAPYRYSFDFNNDRTADEIDNISDLSKSTSHVYPINGSFYPNVTVLDSCQNVSYSNLSLDVKKELTIVFIVKDNKTEQGISDAKIAMNSNSKYTNDTGGASFVILQGSYDVSIQQDNYYSYTGQLNLSINATFTFKINRTDESIQPPQIDLIAPLNNQVISYQPVSFVYEADDSERMNCSLYTSSGDGWWVLKHTDEYVSSASKNTVVVSDLESGTYTWKVECTDIDGNINTSLINSFSINIPPAADTSAIDAASALSDEQLAELPATDEVLSEINTFKSEFYLFSATENDIAFAIGLDKQLETAITDLTRVKRDLNNLIFRKVNESEREALREALYQKIEDIKNTTPRSIHALESHEFVKYPTKADVESVIKDMLTAKNITLTGSKLSAFIDENFELQKFVTTLTKIKVFDIEYISGRNLTYTLVQKELQIKDNISNATFLEVIPKKLAETINGTEILTDYEIVKDDPIISIDINKNPKFNYIIKKRILPTDAENILSLLISNKIKSKGLSQITGYSIFNNLKPMFLQSSQRRLTIEITLVILLVIVYLAYSLNVFQHIDLHNLPFSNSKLKEITNSIDKGFIYAKEQKYEEAKGMYKSASIAYKELPEKSRANIKERLFSLCYEVDVTYISILINQATQLAAQGKKSQAFPLYKHITEVYKRIAPQYKKQVLAQCTALYQKLK
jgi:hypothetical protein